MACFDAGQDCLIFKDKSGKQSLKGCLLVDVVEPCLPILLDACFVWLD